ncbi:ricin-type beta-trefoil lectin domain protein [Actinomadura rayongensis]|uniref:S8 family serine peptidase n=1 Tax=Actinomadura rayongensis TaxID=1429076 RepID=A0A6I4W884_9ACTN|nr:ricin-type beta-trefoil lectin domain protein [Actinomadura rayongensis]MXQ65681.1 S8 family serine peptidase [Actinomadura rayongensis]
MSGLRRFVAIAAAVVVGLGTGTDALAAPRPAHDFSREKGAPGTHGPLPKGYSTTQISVKFRDGRDVRVRNGRPAGRDAADLARLLARYPGAAIAPRTTSPGVTAERLRLEKKTGRALPDLTTWFLITVPKGIEPLLDALNGLPAVEIAQAVPLTRTPSDPRESYQKYRTPAVDGVNAAYAQTLPGGKGDGVTVFDVEGGGDYAPSPQNTLGSLAASDTHTLMVTYETHPGVWAWGDNSHGQLGDGTTTSRPVMAPVKGLTDVKAVSAGDGYSVALKTDGTVWAWGDNASGQLGTGNRTSSSVPVQVTGLSGVTGVSASRDGHVLAALSDGRVMAWGAGTGGQLGNGTTADSTTPVAVSGISTVASGMGAVSAGYGFSTALLADGTVRSWGHNDNGELGNGTTTDSTTPVVVGGIGNATQVSAGGFHTLALLADKTVKAWGLNASGQLGSGSSGNSATPVAVSGLSGVAAVSAGTFFSTAVKSGATLWTWGDNSSGQLGTGSTADAATPVQAATSVATVAAGYQHVAAVFPVRSPKTWGDNASGQLGTGTTTSSTTPVAPRTLLNVWNACHEDLANRPVTLLTPLGGGQCRPGAHGTPVIGIVGAQDDNGVGMSGVAPNAPLKLSLVALDGVAAAVSAAHSGDVILLEAVAYLDGHDYPLEVDAYWYNLILQASAAGVTVIEPTGNTGNDLDSSTDPHAVALMSRGDSGGIVVGAGEPPSTGGVNCNGSSRPAARTAEVFSGWGAVHGSRVNVQGYGTCVATIGTPGYQDLTPDETNPNALYRDDFNGASAASPIVAGAVASLQGIAKQATGSYLTPSSVRQLLIATGTPQPASDPNRIGPLPDLKAAVSSLLGGPTGALASDFQGKCVDVNQSNTANGTPVQLWDCNNSPAQTWTRHTNGTVTAFGKCLDVTSSGTANGTKVQLYDCNNSGAQQWTYNATTKALQNPLSGRCLDIPNSVTTNGTQLQIYDCNTSPAQRWTVPS